MQKLLRKADTAVTSKPSPPKKTEVNIPIDTANLTIQQRIALMKGKSMGGLEVTAQGHSSLSDQKTNAPSPPMKPKIPPKQATPQTPLKPPSASSLSAPDGIRRYPGYDHVTIRKDTEVVQKSSAAMVTSCKKYCRLLVHVTLLHVTVRSGFLSAVLSKFFTHVRPLM